MVKLEEKIDFEDTGFDTMDLNDIQSAANYIPPVIATLPPTTTTTTTSNNNMMMKPTITTTVDVNGEQMKLYTFISFIFGMDKSITNERKENTVTKVLASWHKKDDKSHVINLIQYIMNAQMKEEMKLKMIHLDLDQYLE